MQQPCISCGRETRPGTRLYGGRKRGQDTLTGENGLLCLACQPGSAKPGAEQSMPVSGRYVVVEIGTMQSG